MEFNVITAVTTEPVTLAEAKSHLHLTSGTLADDTNTQQSITPASHSIVASYGLEGATIDVSLVRSLVNLNSGTYGAGGSVTAKIEESDDDVSWQDFTGGAFTVVTEANDNAIQEIEYTGVKQYIRVVATVAGAACVFGADVISETGSVAEDDEIEMWITTAREYCENVTGRALATQTIELYMDCFPYFNYYELPSPPLQSVTSVTYRDSAGDITTLTADTDYIVDDESDVGRIVLPYGNTWDSFTPYSVNPIKTTIVTGYYASNLIPRSFKQAILLLVGHWYENREAVMAGALNMTKVIEIAVHDLISMYRVEWL